MLGRHYQVLRSLVRSVRQEYRQHAAAIRWREAGVSVSPEAIILTDSGSQLELGRGASIGRNTILNVRAHRRAGEPASSRLEIGERTAILEFNNIRAGGAAVRIGRDCLISQYVTIVATNHLVDTDQPARHAP